MLAADDKVWDQNAFNDLFRRGLNFATPRSPDRTFMCAHTTQPQGSRGCEMCAFAGALNPRCRPPLQVALPQSTGGGRRSVESVPPAAGCMPGRSRFPC